MHIILTADGEMVKLFSCSAEAIAALKQYKADDDCVDGATLFGENDTPVCHVFEVFGTNTQIINVAQPTEEESRVANELAAALHIDNNSKWFTIGNIHTACAPATEISE